MLEANKHDSQELHQLVEQQESCREKFFHKRDDLASALILEFKASVHSREVKALHDVYLQTFKPVDSDKVTYKSDSLIPEPQWIDIAEVYLGTSLPFLEHNLGAIKLKHLADFILLAESVRGSQLNKELMKKLMVWAYHSSRYTEMCTHSDRIHFQAKGE